MRNSRLRGLYAVTPEVDDDEVLARRAHEALIGGARLLQYRSKGFDRAQNAKRAAMLASVCRRFGVPLVINDDVDLVCEVGADGVHLGRDDMAVERARSVLGNKKLIGASCYDDLDRARAAVQAGADYVAFGSVYPSTTKPNASRASLELLAAARAELGVPIAAIGGITIATAGAVIDAGADLVAVIGDLFGSDDVAARARVFARLFEQGARA